MDIRWDADKNELLKNARGVLFEDVVDAINNGEPFKTALHPNKQKYPNQKLLILKLNGYTHVVPYIEEPDHIFLKTIFPSRKHDKKERKNGNT